MGIGFAAVSCDVAGQGGGGNDYLQRSGQRLRKTNVEKTPDDSAFFISYKAEISACEKCE